MMDFFFDLQSQRTENSVNVWLHMQKAQNSFLSLRPKLILTLKTTGPEIANEITSTYTHKRAQECLAGPKTVQNTSFNPVDTR